MKAMVGLIITILIIFIVNLFWPFGGNEINTATLKENKKEAPQNAKASTVVVGDIKVELNKPSDDEKVNLMKAEYATLEQERKVLKRRLSRLKHEMWGLKFSPDKARQMSQIMLNSTKLVKNPDMLGAFANAKEIQEEIAKVRFAEKSVDQVSKMIEENKSSSK